MRSRIFLYITVFAVAFLVSFAIINHYLSFEEEVQNVTLSVLINKNYIELVSDNYIVCRATLSPNNVTIEGFNIATIIKDINTTDTIVTACGYRILSKSPPYPYTVSGHTINISDTYYVSRLFITGIAIKVGLAVLVALFTVMISMIRGESWLQ